ncbi:histidine kinase [uncultured Tenacibaculum sp.]|uniref:sensor histidine kinase n=1 Tax=uncultured Tenacibaculum sp. TaxID=174713 RepID=UPI00262F3151|nr:histidine kinase [uncultured Tenacibaculum sp.]
MDALHKFSEHIRKNQYSRHVLFWLILFSLDLLRDVIINDKNQHFTVVEALIFNCISFLTQILASYFVAYLWIPKFIKTKKYLLSVVTFLLAFYLFGVLSRVLVVHVAEPLVRTPPFEQESIQEIFSDYRWLMAKYIPTILLNVLVFVAVKYYFEDEREKSKKLALAKEKSEIELKTLKGQLNPHFLFNTLNNIYSLSVINSPKTSTSISKLSEILDHVLYRCNGKYVLLSSEIDLLKNFIELEKLRYDERLKVSFTENIDYDIEIPPLILLSLVENAFKHGAGEDSGSPEIDIDISSKGSKFQFVITNTVAGDYEVKGKDSIGLSNIRKQLDLICGNNYELDIKPSENRFTVTLKINQE